MSSEKKTEIASRKKYSASTRPAMVEACSGKSGVPDHISESSKVLRATFPAEHHDDERAQRHDGGGAGDADHAHDDQAVAAGRRVVVIAVEQQRIDRRADAPLRGFHDGVAQIARAV